MSLLSTLLAGPRVVWRRLPRRIRRLGYYATLATRPMRLAKFARRSPPPALAPQGPISLAGYWGATSGLAQGARLMKAGLEAAGCEVVETWADGKGAAPEDAVIPSVLISHINPLELEDALDRQGEALGAAGRHIGIWLYELPIAPTRWRRTLRYVDEVWAPSRFNADAIRRIAPPSARVRVVPFPLFVLPRPSPDRARFGLPDGTCVVLTAVDLRSSSSRKNPLGCLEAWLAAFPTPRPDALWVCKVSQPEADPATWERLQAEAASRADIRLVEARYAPDEMLSLVASVDIILSLHRAEGFGLMLAEGAWLGKALIATNWSAPTEFLHPEGAELIGYRRIPIDDPQRLYPPAMTWADPDVQEAAAALRRLASDPAERVRQGRVAQAHAETVFDKGQWIAAVREALAELGD